MGEIVARWEWRTFGTDFGAAEGKIRAHERTQYRESGEVYVLSRHTMNNTKIRDGLLDIKVLKVVNDDKLEQWYPILKEGFPIGHAGIETVYRNWGLPEPVLKHESYPFADFMAELVKPVADLRAVNVFKERHGFMINGCIVEIADLHFDATPIRTVAVEHADAALVMKTVRELSLDGFENINYLRALKQFVGM